MSETNIDNDILIKDVVKNSLRIWNEPLSQEENSDLRTHYAKYIARKWIFIIACIILSVITIGYALTVGDYPISVVDCYKVLWEHMIGDVSMPLEDSIIFELRLPRMEAAILAGIGLAVAGVVMQSTMMNPLADAYTTGVSSGAGLGATLAIAMKWTIVTTSSYGIVVNAFVFSLVPMLVIISLSRLKNASPTTMIMGGLAIMYLFNAFTTVFTLMADPNDLQDLYRWTVGSLGFAGKEDIPIMAVFVIPLSIILFFLTKKLNALASGDETAKSLGIDADMFRRICLILVALIVAATVSFTGLIGFVGLVCPHIARIFIGADNRYLLPASAVFGAFLLLISDLIGRTIISPATLQVGVIMSFIGGPLFLWLILRKKSNVW